MPDTARTEDLSTRLRGELVTPEDAAYDEARAVWNAMIDRRPALIARCRDAEDVAAAVGFARDRGLRLAVRGGGHNIAGSGVCDDGLVIDLSPMSAIEVDPRARVARVEGGALLGDLDCATQAFGLAVPAGVVSTTGVAGLTLGGGFGWLARKHGLAADNLLSVELVTAAGERLRASSEENPELFWGLRGGGGNFGVATAFEFRLHPLGPEVFFGPTFYRLEEAAEVLAHYRDFAHAAPPEVCVWADLLTAPALPFIPEAYHGSKVLSLMQFHAGDPEDGAAALAPLRGFGTPIADAAGPLPYTTAQSLLDETYAKGLRNYWTPQNFTELSDAAIDALVTLAAQLPTPQSDILISQVGGAINEVAPEASAYPHRNTAFVVTPGARWTDPAGDGPALAWIHACREALAPLASGGAYVNFIAESQGREQEAYGGNYARLAALKARYDPENLFRFNQNLRPPT